MRVMSKIEGRGGALLSREEGMGGLCQGKKGRGDGRLMSREEGKGGWEAYIKGRSEEKRVKGLTLPFSSK